MRKVFNWICMSIVALIIVIGVCSILGYIQEDHLICECISINGNSIFFEAYGDNIYEWETDTPETFVEGEKYSVDFFDFEDFDVTNNEIVRVGECVIDTNGN